MSPEDKRLKRNAYQRQWAANHRDYGKQYRATHKVTPRGEMTVEEREERRKYLREWRRNNKERNRLAQWRYRQKNLPKFRAYCQQYRDQREQATPLWANRVVMEVYYTRRNELNDIWGTSFEVDHIVPILSELVCGLHCEFNLQILDSEENNRKHNTEWPDMPDPIV